MLLSLPGLELGIVLGLGSEFQLGLGVRSGARIRDRAKIKFKFMGRARVQYVSMVSVWVHLAATDGFRVRPRVNRKF